MSEQGFPVEWKGQTYYLGPKLTAAMKTAFCQHVRQFLINEAIASLASRPDLLDRQISHINSNPPWWTDGLMHPDVANHLSHPVGDRKFNRLLFGESGKIISDGEFEAMLAAKEKEQGEANLAFLKAAPNAQPPFPPANDYFVAMKIIRETADPKANGAAVSPVLTVAPHTAAA